MIEVENKLISKDVFEKKFVCDLNACKGACCVEGDAGAPLEKHELEKLEKAYPAVKPYMRKAGIEAVEKQGPHTVDSFDGEHVTPLVNNKECAYVYFDENNKALCAIEKAYRNGDIDFMKPISCHLYPIRIQEYRKFDAVNYDKWEICNPACKLGESLQVPVYQFAKDALIRKYGEAWYAELPKIHDALNREKQPENE